MGNLYDWFIALLGITTGNTSSYNSNVIYCACICAIVLFCVAVKFIFRGFSALFGFGKIS